VAVVGHEHALHRDTGQLFGRADGVYTQSAQTVLEQQLGQHGLVF
jgi:hypothetical protein